MNGRPLVTFAMLTYNQERFIREAVEGAFSQTYSPLEIILSDDCSSDRTFDIMREMSEGYTGAHAVRLNRNPVRLGLADHVNRVAKMSKGAWIVGAAGDDISLPMRVDRTIQAAAQSPHPVYSVHSLMIRTDVNDQAIGFFENPFQYHKTEDDGDNLISLIKNIKYCSGASHAWRREVFDRFGPINSDVVSEDCVIPFRSCLLGDVIYIDEPLVRYRLNPDSITQKRRNPSETEIYRAWYNIAIYRQFLDDITQTSCVSESIALDIKQIINDYIEPNKIIIDLYNSENPLKLCFALRNCTSISKRFLLKQTIKATLRPLYDTVTTFRQYMRPLPNSEMLRPLQNSR